MGRSRGRDISPEPLSRSLPDWNTAEPAEIAAWLADPQTPLDSPIAQAVRNRAAQFLLADPSQAYVISRALLGAARRRAATTDAAAVATAWRCHAEACLYSGRTRAALEAYEQATMEAERARAYPLLGQILVGRVHLLSLVGSAARAERLARRAERLLRKAGDVVYLGKLYMNRGNARYQQERYAEAYTAYREADEIFAKAGLRDATWVGLIVNQAIACAYLSRVAEARRLFLRAERECERLNLESLQAHVQHDRAFLEAHRGDYRAALALLEKAGATFARQGIRDMDAAALRSRAEIYLDLGMGDEARDLAAEAAAAFEQEGMTLDVMLSRLHEARGLLLADRAETAEPILERADRFYARRRVLPRRAAVLVYRARAALRRGDAGEAMRLARRASRIFARLAIPRAQSEAIRMLAEALLARRRWKAAEEALGPALALLRRQGVQERLAVWGLAGRISRRRNRRTEATRRLRRAAREIETQRRLIPGAELRARAFEEHVNIYHELIAHTLDTPSPRFETLFDLVEAARARGFRDRLGSTPAKTRKDIQDRRAVLGSLVRRLEEEEYAQERAPDPATIRRMQSEIRTLERKIGEQIRRAEGTRPGGTAWSGAADPTALRRRLRGDEALIEYFVIEDRILALVLTRASQGFRVLPMRSEEARAHIRRMHFQLETLALAPDGMLADPAFLRRSAEQTLGFIHAGLLEPLAELLPPAGRLVFVPHRFLHRVPFECLWDGGAYIDARYAISRCPTADFLLRRARRRSARRREILVSGIVSAGPAAVASEIESIAALLPRRHLRVLRDPSTAELLNSMDRCRLLHLSTHGVFREDNPLFSRLTTGDGALFLADLLDARMAADLVVLSACNSGQVFTGQGDDLSGVAHGFLAAGAGQLVASLWRVHDEATRALMEAFYRQYASGESRGDASGALRAAGQEVRRRWDHPFYWGCFSIHGR